MKIELDTQLVASHRVSESALRVARRFVAKEFPNEKALARYLKEHPHADKAKHFVEESKGREKKEPPALPEKRKKSEPPPLPTKKKSEPPPLPKKKPEAKPSKEEQEAHEIEHGGPEKVVTKLKSFGQKAMSLFFKAPKAAQDFVTDPGVRKKAIEHAKERLTSAPEKIVRNLVKTAREEVHEFHEASEGVKAVLKGGKMSKSQRHAFKKVAFHVGLTAAATALTAAGGPLAASAAFGKSIAKHVALKSVSRALGHFHVLEEMGHIGHGVAHVLHKLAAEQAQTGKKPDPDEVLVQYVMAAVARELDDLDLESIGEALSADEEKDSEKA